VQEQQGNYQERSKTSIIPLIGREGEGGQWECRTIGGKQESILKGNRGKLSKFGREEVKVQGRGNVS